MGSGRYIGQIRDALAKKFVKDTLWILASNVLLGLFGILTNALLVSYYGPAGLGRFMLAFSVYLLLHMIAVLGVGNSVTKYTAEEPQDEARVVAVLSAGIVVVGAVSLAVASIAWAAAPLLSLVYPEPEILAIHKVLVLGLPVFALNKVLSGLLNGLRNMIAYAAVRAGRYVLVCAGIVVIHGAKGSLVDCAWAVPAAEVLLLVAQTIRLRLWRRLRFASATKWLREHLWFGAYSCLHDFAVELTYRIDILLAGAFLEPFMVGLYVFASDVAKGLTAFSILVQVNLNPILSKLWASQEVEALRDYLRKVRRTTYLMYVPVVALAAAGYPIFVWVLDSKMAVERHFTAFYVLLAGVFIFSGYSAILGVMAYTGHLRAQMRRSIYALSTNALGGLLLIPPFGIIGAAVSTLITFMVLAATTHRFVKTRLKVAL